MRSTRLVQLIVIGYYLVKRITYAAAQYVFFSSLLLLPPSYIKV
jgi:hypothetical protein